jgi:rod shape-determining protein MreC
MGPKSAWRTVSRGRPDRRWRSTDGLDERRQPARALLIALVLASISVITLDYHGGTDSPVEPARRAVGEVFGPIESGAAAALRPVTGIPGWFTSKNDLHEQVIALQSENAKLRSQAARAGYDKNRLEEYDGLTAAAKSLGSALVPARVIAMGPSQSFSRTVMIDAGSSSGVPSDQTVLNNDGLVGRVLRVTRSTATVLLIVDGDSVVGGRIGDSLKLGMAQGSGEVGDRSRLDLQLVDAADIPPKGSAVLTWGSEGGAPYVSGVPIGTVTNVYASLRDTSTRIAIRPYVDFGALDVVGVVVPSGTRSDRAVIEADGSLR